MERDKNSNEKERIRLASKALITLGGLISTLGLATITEGVAIQQGAIGSLGMLIVGTGVSLALIGIRHED